MTDRRYQIFVSSTFEDLRDHRDAVIKSILEMGHFPVGMEMFSAGDEDQWKVIRRQIDQSDYYVVIIAHRYGSTDASGLGFTEKEYDYACSIGVPTLAFVIEPSAEWPPNFIDADHKMELERFKAKVRTKYVSHWRKSDDLCAKVSIALMKQFNINPRVGWMRADSGASAETLNELSRLSKESSELREELAKRVAVEEREREESAAVEEAIRILRSAQALLGFRYRGIQKWENATTQTLQEIFYRLGPLMQVEVSMTTACQALAVMFNPEPKREVDNDNPFPLNSAGEIFADLAALDLVEPSSRPHGKNDNEEYWALTSKGARVLKAMRIARMNAGVPDTTEIKASPTKQ